MEDVVGGAYSRCYALVVTEGWWFHAVIHLYMQGIADPYINQQRGVSCTHSGRGSFLQEACSLPTPCLLQ